MSGVAQPVPAKKIRRLGVRAERTRADTPRCVSFPELAQTHLIRASAPREGEVYTGAAEERYREFEAAFQRQQGRVVSAYWCTSQPSAVARRGVAAKDPVP